MVSMNWFNGASVPGSIMANRAMIYAPQLDSGQMEQTGALVESMIYASFSLETL